MDFRMKDYTTGVTAETSIAEIEKMLIGFGATAIHKECLAGEIISVAFMITGKAYKLPANKKGVYAVLFEGVRPHHSRDGMKARDERAYRVAWRIIKDWLHSQLSIIASGQAQPEQVLLPYMYHNGKTLYEAYVQGLLDIKKLPDKSPDPAEYKVVDEKGGG